jgi:predicted nucleic acid-binding protein
MSFMMNKAFVDTNLLIYMVSDDAAKSAKTRNLLRNGGEFVISVQVLNEFTAACLRKELVEASSVPGHVRRFCRFFDVADVGLAEIELAFKIRGRYGYRWYDCLIIATALLNQCAILYSEDMQDGQSIYVEGVGGLTIVNPLKQEN